MAAEFRVVINNQMGEEGRSIWSQNLGSQDKDLALKCFAPTTSVVQINQIGLKPSTQLQNQIFNQKLICAQGAAAADLVIGRLITVEIAAEGIS